VLRLIIGHGLTLVLVGVAIGLAASFVLTRTIKSLLFGVSATDPANVFCDFAGVDWDGIAWRRGSRPGERRRSIR